MYYDNLPIFKSALDLVVYIETIVKGFERYHKYTIGEDLRNQSKELMFLIQRANMSEDRVSELIKLRDKCEEIKMLIRVIKELKAFKSFKQFTGNFSLCETAFASFEHSSKLSVNICRQAQAWLGKSAGVSR